MQPVYDLIVIGAGPAGCSASSYSLLKGKSVLILEKSKYPRDKICGEFISPAAWKSFRLISLTTKIENCGYTPVQKAMIYTPLCQTLDIPFVSPYGLGLSRSKLDAIMLDHALSLGADVIENILVTEHKQDSNHIWIVKGIMQNSKTPIYFRSHAVLMANGRHCQITSKNHNRKFFGFKSHYKGASRLNSAIELYFMKIGYGGLVEIEDNLTNACFIIEQDKAPMHLAANNPDLFMKYIFKQHPILHEKMKHLKRAKKLLSCGPLSFGFTKMIDQDKQFFAGDAIGMIDPFLGGGITIALESGIIMARANDLEMHANNSKLCLVFQKRFRVSRILRFFLHRMILLEVFIRILKYVNPLRRWLVRVTHPVQ
ncbi:MAG: NAD(P)/FAD-dependent oxidoreductase [Chlamydiota bacterium]|nr:NAD(P)/FAD-dependent oxidoreductase [Chlamydiota bacterium]